MKFILNGLGSNENKSDEQKNLYHANLDHLIDEENKIISLQAGT
jgi:hypothetical protein